MSTTAAIIAVLSAASLSALFVRRTRRAAAGRHTEPEPQKTPLVYRNVRLLRDNDDITAALTRAAQSERRLIEIGERRYARYRQLSSDSPAVHEPAG